MKLPYDKNSGAGLRANAPTPGIAWALALAALWAWPTLASAQQAAAAPLSAAAPAASDPRNGYAEILKPTKRKPSGQATTVIQNQPYAPIRKPEDDGQIPEIEMFVGESRVFPAPGVARIAVGNGSLLTAAALDNKEVILFANGAGTSSLFVWNADGRYQRVKISIVPGDTTRHAREIAAFLSTIPKAKASVVGANIIVEGDELSDADITKIEDLAKRYPQIVNFTNRVGWEQMVMLDVKVVEFPVTLLRDIGLKWTSTGGAAVGGIWMPGSRGSDGPYQINISTGQNNAPPITAPGGGIVRLPNGLNILSAVNLGLNAQLNLLAQEGKASVLAEPQLSARNGSKASFLAGGEIPYAVVTRDGVYVQFKTYGIKLDITPRVDHRGVIRATIQSEVSSIDRSVSTAAGPALLSRKTDTEFNVHNGETIVLSGLLQREVGNDVDKVPLLGDIPVLGALFRSKRYQNKETELVVFVTPTVVNAQSPGMVDRIKRSTERLEQRMGPNPYLSEPLQPGVNYEKPDAVALPESHGEATVPAIEPAAIVPVAPATPQPIGSAALSSAANVLQPAATVQSLPPARRIEGGSPLRVVADRTALRAEPHPQGALLLLLDAGATVLLGHADPQPPGAQTWRNVVVGNLHGWVPADAVQPARGQAASRPGPGTAARRDQVGKPLRPPLAAALRGRASAPQSLTLAEEPAPPPRQYRVTLDGLALRMTPDVNADVLANLLAGDMVAALPQEPRGGWTAVQYGDGGGHKRGWVASQWLDAVSQ